MVSHPLDAPKSVNMTKLCFGGSFNPLHVGHLLISRAVAEAAGYSKVVLIPTAVPPHKPGAADLAGACHRLAMCQAVATCDSLFEVEDLELHRTGPSYTLDTVRALKAKGWPEVHWLIGADMVEILPQWHRVSELLREVRFVIAERPGHSIAWDRLPPEIGQLRSQVVRVPLLEISASEIRRRVREGKSIRYFVPPEVERYIAEHMLYTP
jgi:nicotinate-nucleotide adenylyltransferase